MNEEDFWVITSALVRLKIRFDALVSKSYLGWVSFYANVGDVQDCLVQINFVAALKCEATLNYIFYSVRRSRGIALCSGIPSSS